MKTCLRILCGAAAIAASLALAAAQTKWDLPSGYGANTFQVQNLQWFADEVDKATAGRLKLTVHANAWLATAGPDGKAVIDAFRK